MIKQYSRTVEAAERESYTLVNKGLLSEPIKYTKKKIGIQYLYLL